MCLLIKEYNAIYCFTKGMQPESDQIHRSKTLLSKFREQKNMINWTECDVILKVTSATLTDMKNVSYFSTHFSKRRNCCSSRNTQNSTRKCSKQQKIKKWIIKIFDYFSIMQKKKGEGVRDQKTVGANRK